MSKKVSVITNKMRVAAIKDKGIIYKSNGDLIDGSGYVFMDGDKTGLFELIPGYKTSTNSIRYFISTGKWVEETQRIFKGLPKYREGNLKPNSHTKHKPDPRGITLVDTFTAPATVITKGVENSSRELLEQQLKVEELKLKLMTS